MKGLLQINSGNVTCKTGQSLYKVDEEWYRLKVNYRVSILFKRELPGHLLNKSKIRT